MSKGNVVYVSNVASRGVRGAALDVGDVRAERIGVGGRS